MKILKIRYDWTVTGQGLYVTIHMCLATCLTLHVKSRRRRSHLFRHATLVFLHIFFGYSKPARMILRKSICSSAA